MAVLIHVLLALWAIAWLAGSRPPPRAVAAGSSALLLSVGVAAVWFDNPFNGAVFLVLAPLLFVLALRGAAFSQRPKPSRSLCAMGWILVSFGWCYPHFLPDRPAWEYLYAAPLGLIPCPSLAFVCGLRLLGIAGAGRAWSTLLASAALFYGLFGVLRLGVALDVVLLTGGIGLLAQQWNERDLGVQRPATRT